MARKLPSILGCAIGFAAAGSGVGSLVGMGVGPFFFPEPPDGQGTMHDMMMTTYGGTLWGTIIGAAVGVLAGVGYAVWARRAQPVVRSSGRG